MWARICHRSAALPVSVIILCKICHDCLSSAHFYQGEWVCDSQWNSESLTARRNLRTLQKYPQTWTIMLNIEHFCLGFGLSANPGLAGGPCTGFLTGLLTCGVVPVRVHGRFAVGIFWVAVTGFIFFPCSLKASPLTFPYKVSYNNGYQCHCLGQRCCLPQNRIWPLYSYLFLPVSTKTGAQLTQR